MKCGLIPLSPIEYLEGGYALLGVGWAGDTLLGGDLFLPSMGGAGAIRRGGWGCGMFFWVGFGLARGWAVGAPWGGGG